MASLQTTDSLTFCGRHFNESLMATLSDFQHIQFGHYLDLNARSVDLLSSQVLSMARLAGAAWLGNYCGAQ